MSAPPPSPPNPRHSSDFGRLVEEMTPPLNSNDLIRRVQNREDLSMSESKALAQVALEQFRRQHANTEGPVAPHQVAEAIRVYAIQEIMKAHQNNLKEQSEELLDEYIEEYLRQEIDQDTTQGQQSEPSTVPDSIKVERNNDSIRWTSRDHITTEQEIIDGLSRLKFSFTDEALQRYFGGKNPYSTPSDAPDVQNQDVDQRDILTALCSHPVLAVELGKHLAPQDILSLFLSCRTFNIFVSNYMLSSIRTWVAYQCPKAGKIFPFKLYKPLLISDPHGRTWEDMRLNHPEPQEVRSIPGLKYLELLWTRERCSRDIIAIMARNGHRLPKTMFTTLLRLWLLMDLSTSAQRRALMRNTEIWSDYDLYNAQLFFIKLGMHFNDPIYGPCSWELLHLMMGQRGLYPLWQLLMRKRFTTLPEILQLKVQYDLDRPRDNWGHDFFGGDVHDVPFAEVGTFHREGWGKGRGHLQRPDELVPLEAVQRGLELDQHLPHMILWGYFDWKTGENLVPTEEEMYIPNEETALEHMDTTHHWKKRHAMKKRWTKLTLEEQQAIIDDDEDETLRALAWADDDSDEGMSESDFIDAPYNPNDEITRGYIMPPRPANHKSTVPSTDDKQGWARFVNTALVGMIPDIDEDEALLAQGWQIYGDIEEEDDFDWEAWLRQEGGAAQMGQNPVATAPGLENMIPTPNEDDFTGGDFIMEDIP